MVEGVIMHNELKNNHYRDGRHIIKGTRHSQFDDEERKDLHYLKSVNCSQNSKNLTVTMGPKKMKTKILRKYVPLEIEKLNDIKAKATHLYTDSNHHSINVALRENDKDFIGHNKELFCAIDGYIDDNSVNEEVVVYRGHAAKWDDIEKKWPAEGAFVHSSNYTSTSLNKKTAVDAHTSKIVDNNGKYIIDAPIIEIRIPKGHGVNQAGHIDKVSAYKTESEVLIKPYPRYKIVKKRKDKLVLELQGPNQNNSNEDPFVII